MHVLWAGKGLIEAAKADVASLTACETGLFDPMRAARKAPPC